MPPVSLAAPLLLFCTARAAARRSFENQRTRVRCDLHRRVGTVEPDAAIDRNDTQGSGTSLLMRLLVALLRPDLIVNLPGMVDVFEFRCHRTAHAGHAAAHKHGHHRILLPEHDCAGAILLFG